MDAGAEMMYNKTKERGREPVKITQDLVDRIARLARLTMTKEEKECMCAQLEGVLGNVADLNRLRMEEETMDETERGGEER